MAHALQDFEASLASADDCDVLSLLRGLEYNFNTVQAFDVVRLLSYCSYLVAVMAQCNTVGMIPVSPVAIVGAVTMILQAFVRMLRQLTASFITKNPQTAIGTSKYSEEFGQLGS